MPISYNHKLKTLYLIKILKEQTDENNNLSISQIISHLGRVGIQAERKSIYSDIELLRNFGIDIIYQKGKSGGYCIACRDFEMPELKLLVDAVQSSKFITTKKSQGLISKLKKLTSNAQGRELQRQVFVTHRNKSINENIYYNIDAIFSAILKNRQISFKYYEFNTDKQKKYKKEGKVYIANPYVLTWSEDNYYLILNHMKYDNLAHYRVDRMADITVLFQPRRPMEEVTQTENLNIAQYIDKHFSMYPGEEQTVRLRFHNSLINVVIDRFGQEVHLAGDGDQRFIITVNVKISPTFIGWLLMFGQNVKILGPQSLIEQVVNQAKTITEMYQ